MEAGARGVKRARLPISDMWKREKRLGDEFHRDEPRRPVSRKEPLGTGEQKRATRDSRAGLAVGQMH